MLSIMQNIPKAIDYYKAVIKQAKDELRRTQEEATKKNDQQLLSSTNTKLQKLKPTEQLLNETFPKLLKAQEEATQEIEQKFQAVTEAIRDIDEAHSIVAGPGVGFKRTVYRIPKAILADYILIDPAP